MPWDTNNRKSKKEGRTPKEIAEQYHEEFVKTFKAMSFSYDLYSKTETEYHAKKVQEIFKKLYDNGYIYEKSNHKHIVKNAISFYKTEKFRLNVQSVEK